MFKNQAIKSLLPLASLAVSATGVMAAAPPSSDAVQKSIADQRSRQIARQVSNAISSHVNSEFDSETERPKTGASADSNAFLPDSLWSTFSWSNISHNTQVAPYNVNLYQTTSGIDKRIGNMLFGVSVAYAGTTIDIGGSGQSTDVQGTNHLAGFTPYFAYILNKNFFISSMTGYNSISEQSDDLKLNTHSQSDADSYKFELALNGLKVIDQWFFSGKVGGRFQHTSTDKQLLKLIPNTLTKTSTNGDVMTYLSSVEGGYAFQDGLRVYTGFYYEYAQVSHGIDSGALYFHAGADYQINKKLSLGAKIQNDINNKQADISTVSLNLRLLLD